MIPIRDENPTRRFPVINYMLLGLNVVVWLWELNVEQSGATWLTAAYGLVPRRLLGDPGGEAFTIVLSMFMHGSWAHVAGNMLFLYIFGDNVEDALGHWRYVAFYLTSGLCAAAAQIFVDPSSTIPMVGASGAIAGVLGGYMVLFPRAPITVLNPVFPMWFLIGPVLVFPAWLVMGEWFVMNFFMGTGSLGTGVQGGVAFFAHIGGFLAGLLLVKPMRQTLPSENRRNWQGWRPPPRPPGFGGFGRGPSGRFGGWPGSRGGPGTWH
jgi:membrane associated rhomboid family serine protease